jgi:hypothetical protein
MPSLGAAYLDPRFRVRVAGPGSRAADEDWWHDRAVRDDFDDFLATYLTDPGSVHAPMLLLGRPGAGKSRRDGPGLGTVPARRGPGALAALHRAAAAVGRAVRRRGSDYERLPLDPRWLEVLLRSLLDDVRRLPPGRVAGMAAGLLDEVSAHPHLQPLLMECLAVGRADGAARPARDGSGRTAAGGSLSEASG